MVHGVLLLSSCFLQFLKSKAGQKFSVILGRFILVSSLWVLPLNPLLGCNTLPFVKLIRMLGTWIPPRLSEVGWHELGWTNFHVVVLKPNSIYSLLNWISFSSNQQDGGGGLGLLPSWHIQPIFRGNGSLPKRILSNQFPTNDKMKFLPLPLQIGELCGINQG